MTSVLEVLLELEFLQADLVRHPLKGDLEGQLSKQLNMLLSSMITILEITMSKDSLADLRMIQDGDSI